MAKNFTFEQNVQFYVNELESMQTELDPARFLTQIAKQLATNDKQRQELIIEVADNAFEKIKDATRDISFGA